MGHYGRSPRLSPTPRLSRLSPPLDYPGYLAPGAGTRATPQYSGWWRRFAAYFIDGIILGVVYSIINLIVVIAVPGPAAPTGDQLNDPSAFNAYTNAAFAHVFVVLAIVWPITLIIGTAYFAMLWSRSGQTLGARALGIRVIREDGQLLSVGGGILRYLVGMVILDVIVFGLPIGYLWAAWDFEKQAWHDKIAGTIVVRV